jgi:hypothetical protein
VPFWELRPIKGLAFWPDLYTSTYRDAETDEFEQWLNSEFETPALAVISKIEQGRRLTANDWERLAWYAFIQDQRTPANFLESMQRWQTQIPETIDRVLHSVVGGLPEGIPQRGPAAPQPDPIGACIRIQVRPSDEPHKADVGAEVLAGRKLWIASIRRLVSPNGAGKACCDHKWSIADAANGEAWLTSDHPMIRLNYYHHGNYDFKGGWGNPGTELLLPLTPRYLLYTRIGHKTAPRLTLSPQHTRIVQQCLAEPAHRWIFAAQPRTGIERTPQTSTRSCHICH